MEYELDFGKGIDEFKIFDNFKGMHVINKEINFNHITGEAQGKGKISLRIDEKQEEQVNERIKATPNMKASKVDLQTEKFHKKSD